MQHPKDRYGDGLDERGTRVIDNGKSALVKSGVRSMTEI